LSEKRIKVLHILANSRPDLNGYAVRTHDLLSAQFDSGMVEPIGLTSPFYPERESLIESVKVDDILYLRCPHPLHDDSDRKLGSGWLRRRARNRTQENKPAALEDSSKLVVTTNEQQEVVENEVVEEETTQVQFGLIRRIFREIRKKIRSIYRFVRRNSRRVFHASIRLTRRLHRFLKRNLRRASRPIRRLLRPFPMWVEERLLMKRMEAGVIETARKVGAEVIHAHTPFRVGRPALRAARRLKLPFIYEMRGIWEDTAVANGRWKPTGLAYRRYRAMETRVLTSADRVICISETLRDEAISRGVDPARIHIVQNAVDPEKIQSSQSESSSVTAEDEAHLAETIVRIQRASETCVVGYIGSLRALEGVDDTASAVALLSDEGRDVRLLVVSGVANQDELREHCDEIGLGEKAIVTGPVPHERVPKYYDLIDVFVVSRPDQRVTRLVTPLKPFEAMMMGRAVVCSDLPALAEIVQDGERGLLYSAGDNRALADCISHLIDDPSKRLRLGAAAKKWVVQCRTWPIVVQNSIEAYRKVLSSSGGN